MKHIDEFDFEKKLDGTVREPVDVYVAKIPEQPNYKPLSCAARQKEINAVKNPTLKSEKYYVWKLLEYALEQSFGMEIDNKTFTKGETGKWVTDGCFFSLSHCAGAVAVVVSRTAVGVDIETSRPLSNDRLANKILTEGERCLYEKVSPDAQAEFLLEKWTGKEALFKKENQKIFSPELYDTSAGDLYTKTLMLANTLYVLSVATDTPELVRIYKEINLERL